MNSLLKKMNKTRILLFSFFQEMSDETFESITAGKQDKLEKKIDIEHGLLSKLVAYGIITQCHRTAIEVSFKLLFTEIEL